MQIKLEDTHETKHFRTDHPIRGLMAVQRFRLGTPRSNFIEYHVNTAMERNMSDPHPAPGYLAATGCLEAGPLRQVER